MLHGRLHTTSRETINTQCDKGMNKTSLFHLKSITRVSSYPQERRDYSHLEIQGMIMAMI
jgi:hypothetical protein